jgi:hypothetical protein
MISRLRQATKSAATNTAAFMTQQLRQSALDHGWHPDVVANMEVRHTDGKFNVHVAKEYKDRAFVHEFGNEHTQPTAVVRKYGNDTKTAQKFFMLSTDKHYGGLK